MTSRSRPPCRPRMRGLQGQTRHFSSYTTSWDTAVHQGGEYPGKGPFDIRRIGRSHSEAQRIDVGDTNRGLI